MGGPSWFLILVGVVILIAAWIIGFSSWYGIAIGGIGFLGATISECTEEIVNAIKEKK